MILGEKTSLRGVERADLKQLWEWMQDPELMRLRNRRAIPESFERMMVEYDDYLDREPAETRLAIWTSEEELIGETSLHDIDHCARSVEFSISIGSKAHWGKGYGTDVTRTLVRYSFEQLNLHRVGLYVHDFNERAIRTYLKCGFREEGRLREAEYMDGRYSDIVVMGILRREFQERGTE